MGADGHAWVCMGANEWREVQNNPKHAGKHTKHTHKHIIYDLSKYCKIQKKIHGCE